VLHAVADKDLQLAVVEPYRQVERDLFVGTAQDVLKPFVEAQLVGGDVEARRMLS
jgi:hypothetical protein